MTVATTSFQFRSTLFRHLPSLGVFIAAVAVVLLALGPIGWRTGWWNFRIGFFYLMPWAAYFGIAAVVVSVLAIILGRGVISWRGVAIGIVAGVTGGVAAYPALHYNAMRGRYPPIDDITTDTNNPPTFVAAVTALRKAEGDNPTLYGGVRIAQLQRRAYPDIVPLALAIPPAQAFAQALDTAQRMGWTIVDGDPITGEIEANDRSRWFGFIDDVVIRIAASGAGSRVDMRSSSRHGRGDFGVNAARIRAYLAALRRSVDGQS
jgi:uncharacterized protein (DUF1499 family)